MRGSPKIFDACRSALRVTGCAALAVALAAGLAGPASAQSTEKPAAPTWVGATAGDGSLAVVWLHPGDSSITSWQYRTLTRSTVKVTTKVYGGTLVDYKTTNQFSAWTTVSGSDSSTRSVTITGLTNGQKYWVYVRGLNSSGVGAVLNSVAYVPGTPGSPSSVSLTAGDGSATLTWAYSNSAVTPTGWQYRYSEEHEPKGSWQTVSGGGAARSHTVSGLTNGKTYSFNLRAVNAAGPGPLVNPGNVARPVAANTPARPTGFTLTPGSAQFTLGWDDPSDSTITKWQYSQNYGSWTDIAGSSATTTSHTVTGLTNGDVYSFSIRAVNANGGGPRSPVYAGSPGRPAAPTGFTVAAGANNGEVALGWDDPSDSSITKYRYEIDEDFNWIDIAGSSATTTSHTVTGLTAGQTYTFRVRAVNSASSWGGPATPAKSITLAASVGGQGSADVQAEAAPEVLPVPVPEVEAADEVALSKRVLELLGAADSTAAELVDSVEVYLNGQTRVSGTAKGNAIDNLLRVAGSCLPDGLASSSADRVGYLAATAAKTVADDANAARPEGQSAAAVGLAEFVLDTISQSRQSRSHRLSVVNTRLSDDGATATGAHAELVGELDDVDGSCLSTSDKLDYMRALATARLADGLAAAPGETAVGATVTYKVEMTRVDGSRSSAAAVKAAAKTQVNPGNACDDITVTVPVGSSDADILAAADVKSTCHSITTSSRYIDASGEVHNFSSGKRTYWSIKQQ